ncbi:hypothetical protein [Actinocorallia longicatena]|uniref:PknH-like protein n=1 Tax=Actinocorallia longicatena TaxID=111803 RepID=A0ABP6QJ89_9ACTN
MRRIVRGAVLATGAVMAVAGCGSQVAAPTKKEWSSASLTAAVLSQQDMPEGFLPAQAQAAFRGVVPRDPSCRRLLALADGYGLRDVPKVTAAFYQTAPGATISQQIVHMGSVRAREFVRSARTVGARCPVLRAEIGGTAMALHRADIAPRGWPDTDTYAVRFTQPASRNYLISYEIVMARSRDDLIILAAPGITRKRAPSVTVRAARAAAVKLARAHKLNP